MGFHVLCLAQGHKCAFLSTGLSSLEAATVAVLMQARASAFCSSGLRQGMIFSEIQSQGCFLRANLTQMSSVSAASYSGQEYQQAGCVPRWDEIILLLGHHFLETTR